MTVLFHLAQSSKFHQCCSIYQYIISFMADNILLTHPSVDGHLSWFYFLALWGMLLWKFVHKVLALKWFSLAYVLQSRVVGPHSNSVFMLCRKCQTVFQSVCTILHVVAQLVKNPLAMQETWVWSLGWEDIPWRRAWQPTPVLMPGESPWTEEPGGLQAMGSQRVGHDWATKYNILYSDIITFASVTASSPFPTHLSRIVKHKWENNANILWEQNYHYWGL